MNKLSTKLKRPVEDQKKESVRPLVRGLGKVRVLINHQGFRRYFANTSWMLAEQILRIIAWLLVGIWVARYLGPEQFGILSYVLAFTAIFGGIAKLGLDNIVVRNLVKEPEKRDIYLGTAFWLKLSGAFITLGAVACAAMLTTNDPTTNLYILIVASGMIFQSFEVIDFYFQSQVLSKFVSLCKLIQLILSSLLKLYFVIAGADLLWFVIVSLVDQVTLAISLFLAYHFQSLKLGSFYRYFNTSIAKQLLKDSWPLILSALAVMIYMRIDQIMIKEMLGDREVGLYSAAVRLGEAWYFVPALISTSLFPAILNAKKSSQEQYRERLQKLYTFMVWTAVGVAVPVTILSTWIMNFLYGAAYREASLVLSINIWAGVAVSIGVVFGRYLVAENRAGASFHRTAVGAGSNILLNFIFIPRYGIAGAAIATLASQWIANYIFDLFDRSLREVIYLKNNAILPVYLIRTERQK
jgi:O-antigen/teichoic acid export membrane protein